MAPRGRPPRAGTRATHRIEFYVTDEEFDLIRARAAKGEKFADICRLLLLGALQDERESILTVKNTGLLNTNGTAHRARR